MMNIGPKGEFCVDSAPYYFILRSFDRSCGRARLREFVLVLSAALSASAALSTATSTALATATASAISTTAAISWNDNKISLRSNQS